jgi:outer membrane protein assembly factor BamB
VTAIAPATGRVAWRFNPGPPVTALSSGPAGLTVAAGAPDDPGLFLLDPRTGRVHWAAAAIAPETLPLVTRTSVISVEGGAGGNPGIRLVRHSADSGNPKWQTVLRTAPPGTQPDGTLAWAQPVLRLAGNAVVQTAGPRSGRPAPLLAYHMATGTLAWRTDIPTSVPLPAVAAAGGLLIQASDPCVFIPA